MTAQYDIRETSEEWPTDRQPVWYWFEPFAKWYPGVFSINDEAEPDEPSAHFVSMIGFGFSDHYDAPYWMPFETFRPTNNPEDMLTLGYNNGEENEV